MSVCPLTQKREMSHQVPTYFWKIHDTQKLEMQPEITLVHAGLCVMGPNTPTSSSSHGEEQFHTSIHSHLAMKEGEKYSENEAYHQINTVEHL